MKTVKGKVLTSVEPETKYMGCTFYLEGEQTLDGCVFDNCSFREHLHYIDYRKSYDMHPKIQLPSEFYSCSFPDDTTIYMSASTLPFVDQHSIGIEIHNAASTLKLWGVYRGNYILKHEEISENRLGITGYQKLRHLDLQEWVTLRDIDNKIYRIPTLHKIILPSNEHFGKANSRCYLDWKVNGEHYRRILIAESRIITLGKIEKLCYREDSDGLVYPVWITK